ncbi:uncharacterized protein [Henckelia pumila]|uniref:uncharacterized protein isoform X2 n=1 Tax=Henckelia pumila TaxID=405737 RepID=UPI003C6DBFDA
MAKPFSEDESDQDPREFIWLEYDKFAPENHKVSSYITSLFYTQTCEEGYSWKFVTEDQRQWYWDEFVRYRWVLAIDLDIKRVWYINTKELYRQTIHRWRSQGKHPETITEETWSKWTAVWASQDWLDTAKIYKANKHSEPAGPGTGQTKHTGGSKSYAMHVVDMRKKNKHEPNAWEVFLQMHRTSDGKFVDERSKNLNEKMEAYMLEAMTPLEDGTIHPEPTNNDINEHFKLICGGRKNGRMYGLSTLANTMYPAVMAPRQRGFAGGGENFEAFHDEARAATQRANEADQRALEATRECEAIPLRVEEHHMVVVEPQHIHAGHRKGAEMGVEVHQHLGAHQQAEGHQRRGVPFIDYHHKDVLHLSSWTQTLLQTMMSTMTMRLNHE